ncbi:TldD/PmbA family protein [Pelagibius sp. Alg239-R121]|uniref:TldD/PmbA family protein n=1 Tax=Pelagibius sp. Alg239-R121 TaxID=2993448 RepID=UPI0024A727B8|nr:TldD/PmbA family protein [Pelagibius sp. Alg239-R121]
MTTDSEALNLLEDLIKKAKALGADAADALVFESAALSHSQRLGQTERMEREESRDLGLRVFKGQRQAMVSSTDMADETLSALAERAVAMAGQVPEDEYCGLADPELLATTIPEIDLYDAEEPTPETLIERARLCEEAAMAVSGVTNSEGAEAGWGSTHVALATSTGFAASYASSGHSVGIAVLAGEGSGMERDYDFSSAVYGSDLEASDAIGRKAGEKAVRRLNPQKPATGHASVVFDPRTSGGLLRHLAGAINGAGIARGTSFLKDKLDAQIFAEGITIVDDPHRPRGLSSKPFDGEGVANKRRSIVENGRLTTWIMDLRSSRQLGLATTGHASRGTSSPPSPSTTNLHMEAGSQSPDELIADISSGIYVTELMGMGVNGVTGDYSRGAAGFWIENGVITHAVSEATIAGNLKDMFLNLTPANDLVFRYGTNAPTLRIEGMTIAGA